MGTFYMVWSDEIGFAERKKKNPKPTTWRNNNLEKNKPEM